MPKVMHLSGFPGPELICNGAPERRCVWHSLAGQPMACGWPLWASVFLVFVPVLNSQAGVFRSQGLGQGQGRQRGEERNRRRLWDGNGTRYWHRPPGSSHLWPLLKGFLWLQEWGAEVRDPWQQRWELLHKYPAFLAPEVGQC